MKKPTKCRCRPAKAHRDCAYCGTGGSGWQICGVCKLNGVDGNVIRGTSQVVCSLHKPKSSGCYCVICLCQVPKDVFVARNGCCERHTFDEPCQY